MKRLLAVLCVIALGTGLMLFVTRSSANVTRDSLSYINAARRLNSGAGLTEIPVDGTPQPFNHFPPLFPVLLAVLGSVFGADPWQVSRIFNSLLFGVNAALVGLLLYRYVGRSLWLSAAGVFFMLTARDMIMIHSSVWTEPLFIACMLISIYYLLAYLMDRNYLALLIAASAISVGLLTRWVGFTVIAAELVILLALPKGRFKPRLRPALIFAAVSCAPMALWNMWNAAVYGSLVDRQLVFHPVTFANIKMGMATIASWFGLDKQIFTNVVLAVVGAGIAACAIWLWKRHQKTENTNVEAAASSQLPIIAIVISVVYFAVLVVSISLADAATMLDMRILSPVFVLTILVLCYAAYRWFERGGKLKWAVPIVITMLASTYVVRGTAAGVNLNPDWQDYASSKWQNSAIITSVRNLPDDAVIVTNDPYALYFFTGRTSYLVPVKFNSLNLVVNVAYANVFATTQKLLQNEHSVLVYFDVNLPFLASEQELQSHLPLRLLQKENIAAIYQFDGSGQTLEPGAGPVGVSFPVN
jgi:hypothetical protein